MKTKDGYMSIAPYVDDRRVRFFQAAGHPEVLEEERFIDKPTRRKNMTQMYEVAETILPEKTTAEWLKILKEVHVPAMRASEIGEVLDDPHLNAGGFFKTREHPTEGAYIEVRQPVRFSGMEYPDARHAPAIGQHTAELNRELGIES